MGVLDKQLDRLIRAFVIAVTAMAGEAAAEALADDLGETPSMSGRRSKGQLEQTRSRLKAFVAKHPGLRMEQINAELGTTTRELALPIKTLLADGVLRTTGQRRATRYFLSH